MEGFPWMGKKKIDAITPAQTEALEALCRFADEKGYPPTVMELSAILGISQASAYDRINQLVSKGYLRREDCKARGLTVTNRTGEIAMELVPVPIIGAVAAGQPIFAEENFTGEVLVDSQKVRSGRHFALHVSGKSMIGAGIDDGDLVIVRQQALAENGDIVVALLNDDATVKRLKILDGLVELIPENENMKPIQVAPEDDIKILGKVVGWTNNNQNSRARKRTAQE